MKSSSPIFTAVQHWNYPAMILGALLLLTAFEQGNLLQLYMHDIARTHRKWCAIYGYKTRNNIIMI